MKKFFIIVCFLLLICSASYGYDENWPIQEEELRVLGAYTVGVRVMTIPEAVAAGKYDVVEHEGLFTEENFPAYRIEFGTFEITILQFERPMTAPEAIEMMDRYGYRPGSLRELLALGAACPSLQKQYHLIALKSSCGYWVPELWMSARLERTLGFNPCGNVGFGWHACFIAVKK